MRRSICASLRLPQYLVVHHLDPGMAVLVGPGHQAAVLGRLAPVQGGGHEHQRTAGETFGLHHLRIREQLHQADTQRHALADAFELGLRAFRQQPAGAEALVLGEAQRLVRAHVGNAHHPGRIAAVGGVAEDGHGPVGDRHGVCPCGCYTPPTGPEARKCAGSDRCGLTVTPVDQPRHLYLHVPYCARKCPYCDFNSIAGRATEHAAYVEALLTEIRRLPTGPYDTVFIGGGTPTMLPPYLLARLCAGVRDHCRFADGYEWTCEANPGTSDRDRFAVLAEHGVNRLSLGIQSTHDRHLRFLGRVHDAVEGERAVTLAAGMFARVSCDLIMGLPDQTPMDLVQDLDLCRRHGLGHASVYHLAYEPGTEFHARRQRGELAEIEVERSQTFFEALWDGLADLGLMAYETSNFAKPGQECRHNLAYWRQRDWQAAGAGAVSTLAGERLTRQRHPAAYIAAIAAGGDAVERRERLDARDTLREAWMLGLRLVEGVAVAWLAARGDDERRWRPLVAPLIAEGLLVERDGSLSLTRTGRLLQDEVTVRLMP